MRRNDIMIMRDDINLNEDELTLARYLHKVVQNDPLTTGVRENLTDSVINYLLTELRFQKYPFLLNLQPDSPTQSKDQIIFAIRVIGSRFTLYKAYVSKQYIESLREGLPTSSIQVLRYPSKKFGYDYADENERPLILDMLIKLRETMKQM